MAWWKSVGFKEHCQVFKMDLTFWADRQMQMNEGCCTSLYPCFGTWETFFGTWVFYAAPQPLFGPSMLAHSPAGPAEPFEQIVSIQH